MHPRGTPPPAAHTFALAVALFICAVLSDSAQAQEKKDPVRQVVRYVAHKEKVNYQGKQVMVLAVEPLAGGRVVELVVKNHDMNKREYDPVLNTDNVNALQRGDAIKIGLDDSRPRPMVNYLRTYDLKPGEEHPRTYVFENSFDKGEGRAAYTAVVLSKFDQMQTVAVPQKKGRDGATEPDPQIMALLPTLKTGEVVEAEVRDARPVPVLVSLDRYTAPKTGKFLKVSEQDVGGQNGSAVEIDQDGKAVKARVPGKLQNKKWVSDAKMLAAVRRLKADAEVVYRTRQDGETLWLKDIAPAPKPKAEKATARDRGGRRRDEK